MYICVCGVICVWLRIFFCNIFVGVDAGLYMYVCVRVRACVCVCVHASLHIGVCVCACACDLRKCKS